MARLTETTHQTPAWGRTRSEHARNARSRRPWAAVKRLEIQMLWAEVMWGVVMCELVPRMLDPWLDQETG